MSERRHTGGPIRQLSLQQSPATASRHPLKKQQSVDAVRSCSSASSNASGDSSLRVTASSMRTGGHFPQEPVTARPTSGIYMVNSHRIVWSPYHKQVSLPKNAYGCEVVKIEGNVDFFRAYHILPICQRIVELSFSRGESGLILRT